MSAHIQKAAPMLDSQLLARNPEHLAMCRQSIETHSKSFALASKLLPASSRDDAAVLYAWCRQVDDAIDESPPERCKDELSQLYAELDSVYSGASQADPILAAFQEVVARRNIPKSYPLELVRGMEMDATHQQYSDMETLYRYCYRVASTVGLMMTHVIGLRRDAAMTQAAHLGIAMQLTNISRDVLEDWERGRLYLPDALLERHGAGDLRSHLGEAFPTEYTNSVASALRELLETADRYYQSGDVGMAALPWRAAFGVRTARLVYSDIGREIARQHHDVTAGRAFVGKARKLALVARAGLSACLELPRRWLMCLRHGAEHPTPQKRIDFSHDLLCD